MLIDLSLTYILKISIEQARGQRATENDPQLVTPNADSGPFLQITHLLSSANSELQGMATLKNQHFPPQRFSA